MKKLLTAIAALGLIGTTAFAADMAVKAPAWLDALLAAAEEAIEQGGLMSAFGTKRTFGKCPSMSAFGGKADMAMNGENVRF